MDAERSDLHGPRRDEELKREVESLERGAHVGSRAEPHRLTEEPESPMGPGEVDPAVRDRSELARHLRPSEFPAGRDALLATARSEGAPAWVLAALGDLPDDREYATVEEVWEATGGPPPDARE